MERNSKPLLLVDVDGPLNPYAGKPTKRPEGYDTHRLTPKGWIGKPLRLWLNPEHGPMLTAFAAHNGLELAWATTWQHDANRLIGPRIGLTKDWPVIEFPTLGDLDWKFTDVAKFASGRDVIWLDDDFGTFKSQATKFKLERFRAGNRTLLHHVSPVIGLTKDDLVTVHNWLLLATLP